MVWSEIRREARGAVATLFQFFLAFQIALHFSQVSELYFQRILKGLVSEEDPAKAKQAVDEATEVIA